MKNLKSLFIVVSFLSIVQLSDAQLIRTRVDFPVGISFPEFVHGGIRYQYADQAQIGLYYGGDMGLRPEIIRTWTIDNTIHFGNVNYYSNRPVWYARQGFTYTINTDEAYIYKYSFINMGLGHDFPLNNTIGINFDMGFILQVRERQDFKGSDITKYKTNLIWRYLLRLQIYASI